MAAEVGKGRGVIGLGVRQEEEAFQSGNPKSHGTPVVFGEWGCWLGVTKSLQ